MSNSALIDYTKISPHRSSPRNAAIKKITIHHMAGNLSVETCGNVFQTRQASAQYGIGTDGRIGQYVDEADRAWSTAWPDNDNQAVNIEVANDGGAPDWHVSDKALNALVDLCVDICKRNGIEKLNYTGDASGNLTRHNMFVATACPGQYLQSKFPWIAEQVNAKLGASTESTPTVPTKTVEQLAKEVIAGKWGKGSERRDRLEAAGYDYSSVQNCVNQMLGGSTSAKSIDDVAREVIQGKWGNGSERRKKLEAAGYDADAVQSRVNQLL